MANPIPSPFNVFLIGGTNLNCPAGAETNIFQSGTISTLDRGVYYAVVWMNLTISIQTTAPSNVVVGLRINNGADLATFQLNSSLLVANTYPIYSWFQVASPPQNAFLPPGANLQISLNPTGQSVICTYYCSEAIMGLFRGPDM